MSPREIYAALFDGRGPTSATSARDWRFVGDPACFEASRFNDVVAEAGICTPTVYVAVTRTLAEEVSLTKAASRVLEYLAHGRVVVADSDLRNFVTVDPMGVAMARPHDA